ncbi:MAG: bifunctional precorrin-2 dehydrogenase/sirohydrochlorin ferrochelatase [Deltaproteobacteria bacterium]|nr:bifunctional precorrin-2 dehydrogenase/sirohydrochlorin ferrochelatase [Deltaproteobacteria bacterium]
MPYYPVMLDVCGRPCLVVGGGAVGARKVEGLLFCGAAVTVVSPDLCPELAARAEAGEITAILRPFDEADLSGMFLVISAADDPEVNRRVWAAAEAGGQLVNVADQPDKCNFILPSVIRQGDLAVCFSTSGKSPALAKKLRKDLSAHFGPEYAVLLDILGAARKKLLAVSHAPEKHKPLFERLVEGPLLDAIRKRDRAAADRVLASVLGPGTTVEDLLGPGRFPG